MIKNRELTSLISTNDQKQWESFVHKKQQFSSSVLLIEMATIFEMLIQGNDCVFVSNANENSESQIFLDNESEEEKEMIVTELKEIREILRLSSVSKCEDDPGFSETKCSEVLGTKNFVEVVRKENFRDS
jgi:protease II